MVDEDEDETDWMNVDEFERLLSDVDSGMRTSSVWQDASRIRQALEWVREELFQWDLRNGSEPTPTRGLLVQLIRRLEVAGRNLPMTSGGGFPWPKRYFGEGL